MSVAAGGLALRQRDDDAPQAMRARETDALLGLLFARAKCMSRTGSGICEICSTLEPRALPACACGRVHASLGSEIGAVNFSLKT